MTSSCGNLRNTLSYFPDWGDGVDKSTIFPLKITNMTLGLKSFIVLLGIAVNHSTTWCNLWRCFFVARLIEEMTTLSFKRGLVMSSWLGFKKWDKTRSARQSRHPWKTTKTFINAKSCASRWKFAQKFILPCYCVCWLRLGGYRRIIHTLKNCVSSKIWTLSQQKTRTINE